MIDKGTIEQVMEEAQRGIVEVVSEFVKLKKRGEIYVGCCPFHNDRTPSFSVMPHKGIYKCFGCGKGGNALHFVMEHEQFSYHESIKYLGTKFHIPVEIALDKLPLPGERESMMAASSFARRFFEQSMFETDEGQSVGLAYFRSRGFTDDTIRQFQLGYSPDERDAFTKAALLNGFKKEPLEKSGLSIFRDNFQADRFHGRVMFPIHNLAGNVTAFGGRVLKTDAKTAKYLNSPESDIYHKSRILYGIFHAKAEIVKHDRCYLVEGYTDVVSMHQAGIANVVASSGTALTQEQIRLIARFTPNITILYDGDMAGIKAALRGIDMVLEEGMNVKVLLLPDGDDPDSFSRKMSADDMRAYIAKHETDFIRFKTGLLIEESKNDPIKRASLIHDIVRSVASIPDPFVRSGYVKECSALMEVGEEVIYIELGKILLQKREKNDERAAADGASQSAARPGAEPSLFAVRNNFELEEREVLRYLVKYGNYPLASDENDEMISVGQYILRELRVDDLRSANPVYNKMLDLFEESHNHNAIAVDRFYVTHPDVEVSKLAIDLLSSEHQLSKIHHRFGSPKTEEDLLVDLVQKVVLELKNKKVHALLDENSKKIKAAQLAKNEELMLQLMAENQKWQKVKIALSKMLGGRTVVR